MGIVQMPQGKTSIHHSPQAAVAWGSKWKSWQIWSDDRSPDKMLEVATEPNNVSTISIHMLQHASLRFCSTISDDFNPEDVQKWISIRNGL